ncbi:MAG: ABC transporter permease [Acidobacteriota bacterium]
MKFEFFIAKRYLTRGRKNSFISTISIVSTIGIAIGVAALIIALALLNGFQSDIRNKILDSTAHIMLNDLTGEGLDNYEETIRTVKEKVDEVTHITPVVFGTVLIKGNYSNGSGAVLRGLDFSKKTRENWLRSIPDADLPEGRNQLMIGKEIAYRNGLEKGDTCIVVSPQTTLSPTGLIPKMRKFTVSGVFKSGLYDIDNGTIVTSLRTAQKLFRLGDRVNYIQIFIKDMFEVDKIRDELLNILPPRFSIISWKEHNAALYTALDLEKTVLFFTLSLIIVVASLNIIAGLILLVIQKIKDIGILLSYGASPKTIRKIFFIQGAIIGITGTALGVLVGFGFSFFANKFELIKIPQEIYQMSHVSFNIRFTDLMAVILVSLIISFTATLIPSKKASSVKIVDAVKSE